jgi:hypothetical protein
MAFPYSELSANWKCAIDFFGKLRKSAILYGIATLAHTL